MATIPEALALAIQYHQAGRLQDAEQIYRQILEVEPRQADALHLLGVLAHQAGNHGLAVDFIGRAIGLKGTQAAFHNNLGEAYRALRRWPEAVACYGRALSLNPDYAEAHYNLGIACQNQGKPADAVACYRRALELKPHYVEAQNNLGNALRDQGKLDEASACYRRALELKPDYAQAHCNLGATFNEQGKAADADACCRRALEFQPNLAEAHYNLGIAFKNQGNSDGAVACYRRALALKPDRAEAHNNLGNALLDQEKVDEAIACFRQAAELKPDFADACFNLGNALKEQGDLNGSVACFRRTLELRPDYAEAHNNLGNALADQGRLDDAIACFRRAAELKWDFDEAHNNWGVTLGHQDRLTEAISVYEEFLRLKPNSAVTHKNLGMVYLQKGAFERGWQEYEWRLQCGKTDREPFTQPRWDGSPLEGRTILLWLEQGLGDTINFIRYAPLVRARGGIVLVAAPAPLVPLLSRCPGIEQLLSPGEQLPDVAVQAPLASLPGIFGTNLDSIPAQVPYLSAEPARLEKWGAELQAKSAFKIGIAWQGNRRHPADRFRSIPLQYFEPLARVAGVRLYSLQKGYGSEQLAAVPDWGIVDLSMRLDEQGAFLDTAAVLRHLDLVVTCDSSLLHLAGALAVPVWAAVSKAGDWRWLLQREDSPWYPTLRLFRQHRLHEWGEVLASIAEEVRKCVQGQGAA